jgi:DNA uptake protein ComE-like DNA-binding protein
MSLRADHKALVFVGAVAVLGAGVRIVRAASGSTVTPSTQAALEHQMASADSAATSAAGRADARRSNGRARGRGSGSRRHSANADPADTVATLDPEQGTPSHKRAAGPLDRRGYVGGRLDLDIATAAQIDSLPGITPAIARRIAADRVKHGPFLNFDGLRRVSGIGPTLIKRLDSLVTFSGAYTQGTADDTTISPRGRAKRQSRGATRRGGSTHPPSPPPPTT